MDNIAQFYTDEEDEIITSVLALIKGMEMKGAIPFRDFATTFRKTQFLKGFFNPKKDDTYGLSTFTCRSDHSLVAARLTN